MKKKIMNELEGWFYILVAAGFCGVLWFIVSGLVIVFEK